MALQRPAFALKYNPLVLDKITFVSCSFLAFVYKQHAEALLSTT